MPLAYAIQKYGEENFYYEELERVEVERADEREIYWIKKFKSNNNKFGYNATAGGKRVPV